MPAVSEPRRTAPQIVVMGVSASGKSSMGIALAARLGVPFVDADDLHPRANVEKMAAGIPLDDEDRRPWLDLVGQRLAAGGDDGGVVIACSALKRAYRDRLRAAAPGTAFVHLTGTPDLLAERAQGRAGHFMPPSLLASQLATLEVLGDDEAGVVLDIVHPLGELVQEALERLG
ncbi:gluconokinase [Agromyces seonyuensis]|uniref:Gluconokinase n=1 Tax=Agromyces seonyuensis TaxID=2662446 RepID=A0A6I4NSG0_9MICO|nr:gluconokinase [Agromyces seonyuensis]MWB97100.1 gluconokinase [Agromyces seonyuensis]